MPGFITESSVKTFGSFADIDKRASYSQSIRSAAVSISFLVMLVTFLTTLIQPCRGFALTEWLQQEPPDSPFALNSLGSVDALGEATRQCHAGDCVSQ